MPRPTKKKTVLQKATNRPTKSNRPTKYQTKFSKLIKKKQTNKNYPKCRNPPCPTKRQPSYEILNAFQSILQKATDLQNIKQELVKKSSKKKSNK